MRKASEIAKQILVAAMLLVTAGPVLAEATESELMEQLRTAEDPEAATIAEEIRAIWAHSGSATIDLLMRRAEAASEAEDNRSAIWHLSTVIDYAPDYPEAYLERARAFLREGQAGQAAADLATVIKANPENFDALRLLGITFAIIGDTEAADLAYARALALYPAMPAPRGGQWGPDGAADGTAI
ncbi:hypothetical protein KvSKV_03865 [Ketogulonicigenium vulgare]|uniref:TPR-domain containing protein n=2 Tax=Ketogulonicigenium vulgare TaxID=92945 RepID=F9Y9T8_KETVW|nr:TPR-domain containing protein [Ketogulonicigenium vulgare WSH-001]ALJ80393.1 hypothetical protein KVH_03895 [Ketogulonicigenium vulgare]ANW33224.1 hypothetical protein KvSKV_03865 [Ketogulonicigenium vulgare]